jgi:hypothetical protein
MTRRWFQIHLSTAIVLMLVAGTLLYFNMQPPHLEEDEALHGIPFQWNYPNEVVSAWIIIATDMLFASLLMFFAWCVCEYAIKLGEVRKP